jgi:hypothetical protein
MVGSDAFAALHASVIQAVGVHRRAVHQRGPQARSAQTAALSVGESRTITNMRGSECSGLCGP